MSFTKTKVKFMRATDKEQRKIWEQRRS